MLVGDFHEEFTPRDLEIVKGGFRGGDPDCRPAPALTEEDREMIAFVPSFVRGWKAEKLSFNRSVLETPAGKAWLHHPQLQGSGEAARWLSTYQGRKWLGSRKGQEWIRRGIENDIANPEDYVNNASSWCLGSESGDAWIRTARGVKFLNTSTGLC